jgi:Na+/H+ antiporter NhaD/arsenite permease-like protein
LQVAFVIESIIIGTSIESIDFVDFIINVAPCVFFFLIPVALILILVEYNYFFTAFKMKELDAKELKKAYPIYDEPRLLISGVVASFVILSFFLHPLHHADTAWVAIIVSFFRASSDHMLYMPLIPLCVLIGRTVGYYFYKSS